MSAILVLGAVATASTSVESFTTTNNTVTSSTDTLRGHCDALERLMGICRSSEDILK